MFYTCLSLNDGRGVCHFLSGSTFLLGRYEVISIWSYVPSGDPMGVSSFRWGAPRWDTTFHFVPKDFFELQKAIWQNDSDEESGPVENGEVQSETAGVTEERTEETDEMLASSKCQRRKCGYCGIYVRFAFSRTY